MINIPIFRAKKLGSDEYVEGYLIEDLGIGFYIQINKTLNSIYDDYRNQHGISTDDFAQIDITTLSIHFPDMIDSQGNKIFASLSEDGKGGDILKNDEYEFVAKYSDCGIILKSKTGELFMGAEYIEINNLKITGIQE